MRRQADHMICNVSNVTSHTSPRSKAYGAERESLLAVIVKQLKDAKQLVQTAQNQIVLSLNIWRAEK